MAKGNTYTCLTCGEEFTYCPKCAISKPTYDAESFCSKRHAKIFAILSKHGCGHATATETLDALNPYDITDLTEGIQAHIDSLRPTEEEVVADATIETEKEVEVIFE